MPNWTINHIEFESRTDCARARQLLDNGEEKGEAFDFDVLVPQPPSLAVPDGSITWSAIWWYLSERGTADVDLIEAERYIPKGRIAFPSEMDERARRDAAAWKPSAPGIGCDVADFYGLGRTYVSNLEKHGHMTWYSWRLENWGSKWNACDVSWGEDCVEFDTAWSPVPEIVEALSRELGIRVYYEFSEEQFDCYVGESVYDSGRLAASDEPAWGTFGAFAIAARLWDGDQEEHRWDPVENRTVHSDDDDLGKPFEDFEAVDISSAMEREFLAGRDAVTLLPSTEV